MLFRSNTCVSLQVSNTCVSLQVSNTSLSPGNNTCFYGKCYYCRESEPACAEGEMMEGSLTLWLPDVWPLQKHRHPWGRTYREGKLARWVFLIMVFLKLAVFCL